MAKEKDNKISIPEEVIISKIYHIRGKKVMLSHDLAELYQVETRRLNEQVKRNPGKFPERYMFQLTQSEYQSLRSHFATLKRGEHSKYLPYAFTEHGILMLSSVLKSERADKVNMLIIDTFVKLNEMLLTHKDILLKLEEMEQKIAGHDDKIMLIFEYLKQFEEAKQQQLEQSNHKRIGFKNPGKE